MKTKLSKRIVDWSILTVMALLALLMITPFVWLFGMSFRPAIDAYRMPPSFFPETLDLSNYWAVLNSRVPFLTIYLNSIIIAVVATCGQLITCSLAAFAFARLKFPGRDSLFVVILLGLMFPAQVVIIPIYIGYAKLGLVNSVGGLILLFLTSSFGIFLLRQFMLSQPKELEEAALMDSAGYFKIFYRISLPQLRPALSALGIIAFTQSWNLYFQASVLNDRPQAMNLPVGMNLLRGYLDQGNISLVMAAMSMAILPVVLLFLLAQRMVIEGITLSGIRG